MLLVVIAFIFRSSIRELSSRVSEKIATDLIKAKLPGGTELDFNSTLSDAGAELVELDVRLNEIVAMGDSDGTDGIPGRPRQWKEAAYQSPRDAVLSGFSPVETAIKGLSPGTLQLEKRSVGELADFAVRENKIDPTTASVIRKLTDLHNYALHDTGATISPSQATNFLTLADRVMITLEGASADSSVPSMTDASAKKMTQ